MATTASSNFATKIKNPTLAHNSPAQTGTQSYNENQPEEDEEHALAWKLFSESQIENLKSLTPPEIEVSIAKIQGFNDYTVCLVDGAKLDYFVGGYLFGLEQKFNNYQQGCFLSLLNSVLENCINKMSLEANIQSFSRCFSGIRRWGVNQASGVECFSKEQCKTIIDYIYQGIFQHYSLYQFLFFETRDEEKIEQQVEMQLLPNVDVPFPSPLQEGLPLELYEKYIAAPAVENQWDTDEVGLEGSSEEIKKNSNTDEIAAKDSSPSPSEKEAVADMILKNLQPNEIKQIVMQMTSETLTAVKIEAETKIKEKETAMMSKLNKLRLT